MSSLFSRQYDATPNQICSWPSLLPRQNSNDFIMEEDARKSTDELIAQSMAKLSFQERQEGLEHLHGVTSSQQEDEEEIVALLKEQDEHLERMKQGGTAFSLAESMDPQFTSDNSFRLMFLRGNRYDAKDAADQMIRYMEMKLKLFGTEKLTKKITLQDLDQDDRDCVENGSLQILPTCDRSNRHIVVEFPSLRSFKTLENELIARFYVYMSVLESQEAQRNGVIFISYSVGEYRERLNGVGFIDLTKLVLAMPIHWAGLHLATSDMKHYVLMSTCYKLTPAKWHARTRLHIGSHIECQYQLSTYGIPRSALPLAISNNDKMLYENHLCWYRSRFEKDFGNAQVQLPPKLAALSSNLPMANDVVFGRKKFQNEGNRKLRVFVRNMAANYNDCNKASKRLMREHLIKEVRDAGGRFMIFLEDDDTQDFEELDLEDVHGKIAQAFRNHRRPRTMPSKFDSAVPDNQQQQDEAIQPVTPGPDDVLFGRKRNNQGNKRVRQLVSELANEYNTASKARKRELATFVVHEIQRSGGRFLRQLEGGEDTWEPVPEEYARGKIAKHFQNSRRPPVKKQLLGGNGNTNNEGGGI